MQSLVVPGQCVRVTLSQSSAVVLKFEQPGEAMNRFAALIVGFNKSHPFREMVIDYRVTELAPCSWGM